MRVQFISLCGERKTETTAIVLMNTMHSTSLLHVLALSLWGWNLNLTQVMLCAGKPPPRSTVDRLPSACANGGGPYAHYGYACPHHMMFSADMVLAAMVDGYDAWARYAVAGAAKDSDCGICWQVRPLDAERHWNDSLGSYRLIVQAVNSGFDVMPGQLDLFMGAGGQGYFTAVNADCQTHYCQGGPCAKGMYAGTFDVWNNAHYSDPNQCYSGGVKWLREKSYADLEAFCRALSAGQGEYKDISLWQSCIASNWELYHQNFESADLVRVACPDGLVRVTGLRRADDSGYPWPTWDLAPTIQCRGDRSKGHFCITTMHDGCIPSCAWPGKVNTDPSWSQVDTCDADGFPLGVSAKLGNLRRKFLG